MLIQMIIAWLAGTGSALGTSPAGPQACALNLPKAMLNYLDE